MVEPVIECPYCHKEIKLTESLAAPLVEATRQEFEKKLNEKNTEVARREAQVREQEQSLAAAKQQIEVEIAEGVRRERQTIAVEEAQKARLLVSDELQGKSEELVELQEILKVKDEKLVEAQRAQAELIRKQRELDDARREVELTVERRVQESLGDVRLKARREAEGELTLKVAERDEAIAGQGRRILIPFRGRPTARRCLGPQSGLNSDRENNQRLIGQLRDRALQSKRATDHLIQAAKSLDQNQSSNYFAGKIKMRRPCSPACGDRSKF
jgi:hypothetical protein